LNGYSELTFQHLPVRFHQTVQAGLDAAARGDFVPTSEVWANVERALEA
jgi:predicted transcriptional regulator